MPHWDDLTEWLKVQIAVMAMDNWELLTFSIHVHPDLESLWVGGGRDVRAMIRDRLRKEFEKDLRPGLEHFFVVEGWSKRDKKEVRLHFHGAALIDNPGAVAMIKAAAARAGGHDQAGRKKSHRAVHAARFTREGPRYINYLFKAARRHDDRLAKRRLTMSRSLVGATRSFWEMITDQPRLGHIAWLSSVAD